MDIAIPKETRSREHRVALTPSAVKALARHGHRLWVESGAGLGAGHSDADFEAAGARVVFSRMEALARGDLVISVFAPEPKEYELLHPGQVLFAFWALPAARPEDVAALREREITAVGMEAIEDDLGAAPVLTAMSEIAGGLAPVLGATLLLNEWGGKGILLGGAPGVPPAHLVIIGAGVMGSTAARTALGMGAQVTLLDQSVARLREVSRQLDRRATTMYSTQPNLEKALGFADLVLAAAAVHGQRAPRLVTREMLRLMKPRSVVMDLAIDMGGCCETSRPTAFPEATYEAEGILHFCVPNLPSTVARSSTQALANAIMPYLLQVADHGIEAALAESPEVRRGAYLHRGRCVSESLARTFGVEWQPLATLGGA